VKVAANDVERILMAAQAADAIDSRQAIPDDLSFGDRVAAFKRAAELSAAPLHWRRVRGAKNRTYRRVLVLRETKHEKGNDYSKCLVPYTESELDHRRVGRMVRHRILHKHYKPVLDAAGKFVRQPETPWPSHWHVQFIRQDRLEETP
jgi:hypothetical protein